MLVPSKGLRKDDDRQPITQNDAAELWSSSVGIVASSGWYDGRVQTRRDFSYQHC